MNPIRQILNARLSPNKHFSGPVKNEDTIQEPSSDQIMNDLLSRLENCALGFEGLLQSFEAILNEEETEDLPAQLDALRKRLDAVSTPPLRAYASTDKAYHSSRGQNFETSFDRGERALLSKNIKQ